MRIKRSYIVLSFRTTLEAMEWEKQCHVRQVPGRLIPLPREISAVRACMAYAAGGLAKLAGRTGRNTV